MSDSVGHGHFLKVLEFLYTGMVGLNQNDTTLGGLVDTAKLVECSHLVTACENVIDKVEFAETLNASIGTWLNDQVAGQMKELYFDQVSGSDFEFVIVESESNNGGEEDTESEAEEEDDEREALRNTRKEQTTLSIFAHKLIMYSRCPVLATMLTGRFSEAKTKGRQQMWITDAQYSVFKGFVEYLYTEHAPIEETDVYGLLVLANKYGVTRLVTLGELYSTRQIDKAVAGGIFKANIDIIEILLLAQEHNASQLAAFCLHFIASNIEPMSKRKEFKKITGANLKYVKENQWPSKQYLEEVAEFEAKMTGAEKCIVM